MRMKVLINILLFKKNKRTGFQISSCMDWKSQLNETVKKMNIKLLFILLNIIYIWKLYVNINFLKIQDVISSQVLYIHCMNLILKFATNSFKQCSHYLVGNFTSQIFQPECLKDSLNMSQRIQNITHHQSQMDSFLGSWLTCQ